MLKNQKPIYITALENLFDTLKSNSLNTIHKCYCMSIICQNYTFLVTTEIIISEFNSSVASVFLFIYCRHIIWIDKERRQTQDLGSKNKRLQ